MPTTDVPFCRPLTYGISGADVVAHKRAVSRAFPFLYPWPEGEHFTPLFGRQFLAAVIAVQKRLGIQATGKIGQATHEALERTPAQDKPGEFAFDAFADKLASDWCAAHAETPEQRMRREAVDFCMLTHALRDHVGYSQRRPFVGPDALDDVSYDEIDCSGFVTDACQVGGLPDPNGRGYDHLGYTQTLLGGTKPTTRERLQKADLVFYGFTVSSSPAFPYGSPTHVAMYVGGNMVVSMGSDIGPSYVPADYRAPNSRTPYRTHDLG